MAFDPNAYTNDYKRQHYDRLAALVPKGKGEAVKRLAAVNGLTVSQLIVRALEQTYKIDLS